MLSRGNHTFIERALDFISPSYRDRREPYNVITQEVSSCPCFPQFLVLFCFHFEPQPRGIPLVKWLRNISLPYSKEQRALTLKEGKKWLIDRRLLQRKGSHQASDQREGKLFYPNVNNHNGEKRRIILIHWFHTYACLFIWFDFCFCGDWPFKTC